MLALFAAIMAAITRCTSPPARTWLSISGVVMFSPARLAWIRALTMAVGFTFRSFIPTRSTHATLAPLTLARRYRKKNCESSSATITTARPTTITMKPMTVFQFDDSWASTDMRGSFGWGCRGRGPGCRPPTARVCRRH